MDSSKEGLIEVHKLSAKILDLLEDGDSLKESYKKLDKYLEERIETYEDFVDNPYSAYGQQFKLNSDASLELGEYMENSEDE